MIRISPFCLITLIFTILSSITIFVALINFKMDISFKIELQTSSQNVNKFFVDSYRASLLKKTNVIRLYFNDAFHNATITEILQTQVNNRFKVLILENFPDILPGSKVPAQAIYKTKKLYEEIFGKIL
ncbi:MAG: hypothetical protein GY679_04995 [Mycoplasma sp.]|nr:hypothetical protein [Mycoplasma sp.]